LEDNCPVLADLAFMFGAFVLASALAALFGAINLGTALTFGQIAFAITTVLVIVRRS
jgi:hypothetical protein